MTTEIILSANYIKRFDVFLKENNNRNASNKSEKLFNEIINSNNFVFDKDIKSKENKKITKYIKKIVSIRPGRKLFKRLLQTNTKLEINFEEKIHPHYNITDHLITLNHSKKYYSLCIDADGNKFLYSMPKLIIFAHELIHALHYLESKDRENDLEQTQALIDPDFDILEEQETIMGKMDDLFPLCENIFRFYFGYPFRIDHQSLSLEEKGLFTISECAAVGALKSVKELIESDRSLLDGPQPIRCHSWWEMRGGLDPKTVSKLPEVTPLNVSLFKRRVEVSNYLLQCGASVNAQDKYWGSPLHLAVKERRLDLMKMLVDMGASIDLKDPKGLTPLRLALQIDPRAQGTSFHSFNWSDFRLQVGAIQQFQEEAIKFLAPLSNLKEIDEQGFSILHHAMDSSSLEAFKTLIKHGADINCKDSKGNTPLMYSIFEKSFNKKFTTLLKIDQLDIDAMNVKGETALSLAVDLNDFRKVDALVDRKAVIPVDLQERVSQLLKRASEFYSII